MNIMKLAESKLNAMKDRLSTGGGTCRLSIRHGGQSRQELAGGAVWHFACLAIG